MIKLEYKTTHHTRLYNWNYLRFCVIESPRDVIFIGKKEKGDPVTIKIYSFKNGWEKIGKKPVPCSHKIFRILPAKIENNERLLVSCCYCKVVWFFDIYSGVFSEALREKDLYPGTMCKEEGNYVYIVNLRIDPLVILKVKCTSTELIVDKMRTIYSGMENIMFMHYLTGVKCIAVSRWKNHVVKAIHCKTGEQVWELNARVGNVPWEPHGLFYSHEHQSLLVCDAN